jgi:hypothetical protein
MSQTPDGIAEIIRREDWRQEMADFDAESSRRLLEAYQRLEPAFESRANAMVQALVRGDDNSAQMFRNLPEYTDFLATIRAEMDSFARILAGEIVAGQNAGIQAGLNASANMVAAANGGVMVGGWVRPDPAAVRAAIGYADSPAMQAAINQFGLNASQNINDLLITAVAQGRNPRQIAQLIADWKNVPYSWAENMSRTTQLYSARDATHEGYRANPDIVIGWMWISAKDKRTCVSCWANDGRIFPISQNLNDHHRGRCTPAPITRNSRWNVGYATGPERFATLDEASQRAIFHNNALYEAWRKGEVDWSEMSEPYQNDIFGEMQRASSLASIVERRR